MRFLIAFVALLGYASASVISPLALGVNAGDAQAAIINANVAAQDTARAINENNALAAESAVQFNTEAVRSAVETNRDWNEAALWNTVTANQNAVAAAQSQSAAYSAAVAKSGLVAPIAPIVSPYLASPLIGAKLGLATPYAAGFGLGYAGLGYAGLGNAGLGYAGLGKAGLGYAGLGNAGLGYAGLGYAGLGLRAW